MINKFSMSLGEGLTISRPPMFDGITNLIRNSHEFFFTLYDIGIMVIITNGYTPPTKLDEDKVNVPMEPKNYNADECKTCKLM